MQVEDFLSQPQEVKLCIGVRVIYWKVIVRGVLFFKAFIVRYAFELRDFGRFLLLQNLYDIVWIVALEIVKNWGLQWKYVLC